MQIVTDIDERVYERIKFLEPNKNSKNLLDILMCSVQNGTPLPKGHGRLIDADKIEYWKNDRPDEIGYHFAPKYIIDGVPTIIEADKEKEA